MKESEIAKTLEDAGFVLQPKRGIAIEAGRPTLRYSREGIRGSFYMTDNYLSATGPYVRLRDKAPPAREDRKGYPVWQGDQLSAVLAAVLATYADADQRPVGPTETDTKPATEPGTPTVVPAATAVEPATMVPSGTDRVSDMETGAGAEAQPEVIAVSEVDVQTKPETGTTVATKTEAVTAIHDSGKTAAATEPETESRAADSGGLFSFYTSFWRMVGAWFGGTKPKD